MGTIVADVLPDGATIGPPSLAGRHIGA